MTDAASPAGAGDSPAPPSSSPSSSSAPPPTPSSGRGVAEGPVGVGLPDRMNPILVRETIQVLNGRAFLVLFVLALLGTLLTSTVQLLPHAENAAIGGAIFVGILQFVFLPVVLIYLPFQSFGSMRAELQGGTAELLLLSNLTPGRIVIGRVLATMAQYVLWLSLFAPLIALTYLLRGVSIGDILLATTVSAFLTLAAASLMTALAAVTRVRILAPLANIVAGIGLAIAALATIAAFPEMLSELRDAFRARAGFEIVSLIALIFAASIVLLLLVAQSQLTHPNENRSTPFRVYYVAIVGVGAGWMYLVRSSGMPPDAPAAAAATALFIAVPFVLFAVTEDEPLSPRMRLLVPKHPLLACLAAPLLPGRGRGFLYLLGVVGGLNLVFYAVVSRVPTGVPVEVFDLFRWVTAYVLIYGGIGAAVRGFCPRGAGGNWIARVVSIGLLFVVFSLFPLLLELLKGNRSGPVWSPLHVLNPFFTIAEAFDDPTRIAPYLIALSVAAVAVNVPAAWRGVRETLAAARARRAAAS